MAPETSAHIQAVVDHRADLYSLGCMLRNPSRPPSIHRQHPGKIAREHAQTVPEPLTKIHRSSLLYQRYRDEASSEKSR